MANLRLLVGIHVFVALQLALPLRYYAGLDPLDERFAWRMFSTTRYTRCVNPSDMRSPPAFEVAGQTVALSQTFHESWIRLAKRGRQDVLDGMATRLCETHPGQTVRTRYVCLGLGGKRLAAHSGDRDECAGGGS